MSQYDISSHHYANPQFSDKNISEVYSIPYESVTLSIGDSDMELTTMISLRDKSAIRNEFKYKGKKSFQLDLVIHLNLVFVSRNLNFIDKDFCQRRQQ